MSQKVCGEIQLVFFIFISFLLGFFLGISFIASANEIESATVQFAMRQKAYTVGITTEMKSVLDQFSKGYEYLKEMAQKNYQVMCKTLDRYMIDETQSNRFRVKFDEVFLETPNLFFTINGFDYTPGLIRKEDVKEFIDFSVEEVTPEDFEFVLTSSDQFFDKDQFESIDVCYFAFLKYDPNYLN